MRPKIICHMISSIDGRLLPARWTPPVANPNSGRKHNVYESAAAELGGDGWLIGRVSMEPYATGTARKLPLPSDRLRDTFMAAHTQPQLAIALDPSGKLHYGRNGTDDEHFVAILSEKVGDAYLAELRSDGVSYLFAGPDGNDLELAMETLGNTFGMKTLLLEGGGIINGSFLKAGLIDEMSLLMYPGIDGLASVPSIFEYHGRPDERPAAGKALRHLATETLDDGTVWLRYRIEAEPT